MNVLFEIAFALAAFAAGIVFGSLFFWWHKRSPLRKKYLLTHAPQQSYYAFLYLVMSAFAYLAKTPLTLKLFCVGMISLEGTMYVLGVKALEKLET